MPHQGANQWCKKFNGRVFYFGKLDDPEAAEKKYLADKDDLAAGRVPRPVQVTSERVDVVFACNAFLTAKRRRVDSGEITERTWKELFNTCQSLTKAFGRDRIVSGLHGADFDDLRSKFAKRLPDELQFHGVRQFSLAGLRLNDFSLPKTFAAPLVSCRRRCRCEDLSCSPDGVEDGGDVFGFGERAHDVRLEGDDRFAVVGQAVAVGQRDHDASALQGFVVDQLEDAAVVGVVGSQLIAVRRVGLFELRDREGIDVVGIDAKQRDRSEVVGVEHCRRGV